MKSLNFFTLSMTTLSMFSTSSHALDAWQNDKHYPSGSAVCHNSQQFDARYWANAGDEPGTSQWGPWVLKANAPSCSPGGGDGDDQTPKDPYLTDISKNPQGGYFMTRELLDSAEREKTSSDLFVKVSNTIRKQNNTVVEAVSPGRLANPDNVLRVEAILPEQSWQFLFPMRAPQYDYRKFLQAVAKFPAFCGEQQSAEQALAVCRKSLATMFAHFTQETGGHDRNASIPEWRQGLYFIREAGCSDEGSSCGYNNNCGPGTWQSEVWPCGVDANGNYLKYYGRGAKQLSYNYNYGPFSAAMFNDVTVLLNHPEKVADTWLNLASAVFFFVYPQPPKPDMLSVVEGSWVPNEADKARGISPGFGATINIINGGIECGHGYDKPQALNRIAYYKAFAAYLGVPIGADEVLGCKDQDSFSNEGAGALNIHWDEDWSWHSDRLDGKSFECKLVPYQTAYFALSEGAYERCLKDKFNTTVK